MKIVTNTVEHNVHIEFVPETTLEKAIVTGIDCSTAKIYRDENGVLQIDAKPIEL
jgi:hypothetical protein